MNFSIPTILLGAGLAFLQLLAAVPWIMLAFLSRTELLAFRRQPLSPWVLQRLSVALAVCFVLPIVLLAFVQDSGSLEIAGRVYAHFHPGARISSGS